MIDPRKTVERYEVEEGYFREMIGDLASKNEELETENHHLQTAAADVMAENVRLEGEVERLTADNARQRNTVAYKEKTLLGHEDEIMSLVADNERHRQYIKRLRAAILPFALAYHKVGNGDPNAVFDNVLYSHFRIAAGEIITTSADMMEYKADPKAFIEKVRQ